MSDPLEDLERVKKRTTELLRRFAEASVVEVAGVVDPEGVSGARFGSEGLWTLRFSFAAWRKLGGAVQTATLPVLRLVSDEQLKMFQAHIQSYSVLRVKVRLLEEGNRWHAQLEKVVGRDRFEKELLRFADELQNPVVHSDAVFGDLMFDRVIKRYSAKVTWCSIPIKFNLNAKDEQALDRVLLAAKQLWETQADWHDRVREFALKKLLSLKNGEWLGDHDAPLSEAAFLKKMQLRAITIDAKGNFEFWHADGGMFLGHDIMVSGNLVHGPRYADIPG